MALRSPRVYPRGTASVPVIGSLWRYDGWTWPRHAGLYVVIWAEVVPSNRSGSHEYVRLAVRHLATGDEYQMFLDALATTDWQSMPNQTVDGEDSANQSTRGDRRQR